MKYDYSKYIDGRWSTIYHMTPKRAKRVLDYGSNEGILAEIIRQKCRSNTTAADIDPQYIEQGRKKHPHIKYLQIRPHIPLKIQNVDLIIFSDVLEHIPKQQEKRIIKELHSYGRKGSLMILSTPNSDPFKINFILDPANFFIRPLVWIVRKLKIPTTKKGEKYMWENNTEGWHRHYSLKQLKELLLGRFDIIEIRQRGSILTPIFYFLTVLVDMPLAYIDNNKFVHSLRKIWIYIPQKIMNFDLKYVNLGRWSYHNTLKLRRV